MADEITISSGLTVSKDFLTVTEEPGAQEIDMAGTRYTGGVQDIGFAAHEAISLIGDFGTAGWAFFHNLDPSNFVQLGRDSTGTFVPFAKLLAGEHFVVPLADKAVYAKADTAAVKLKFTLVER